MLDTLERGELLLGDAYFATYFLLCALHERGIDGVFEQQGARGAAPTFGAGDSSGNGIISSRCPSQSSARRG